MRERSRSEGLYCFLWRFAPQKTNVWMRCLAAFPSYACLFLSLFLIACQPDSKIASPPLSAPFSVEKPGEKIEFQFRITEKKNYRFKLFIQHKKGDLADRERLWGLVGNSARNKFGELIDYGIPIPLNLKLVRKNKESEQILIDKTFSKLALYAHDSDGFDKEIVDVVLDSGDYQVNVESLNHINELIGCEIKFSIVIAYQGK
jgi:hypothetical protein